MEVSDIVYSFGLGLVGLGVYGGSFVAVDVLSRFFSRRIGDEEELAALVEEEKDRLDIRDAKIEARFEDQFSTYCSKKEGGYELVLGAYLANTVHLRHEMYHIKRICAGKWKPAEGIAGRVRYIFVEEPLATIYGCFGKVSGVL